MKIKIKIKDSELLENFSFVWNRQNQVEELNFKLHYEDIPGNLTFNTYQSGYMLYIEVNKFINYKELDVYSQLQDLENEFDHLTTIKSICEDDIHSKIKTLFSYLKKLSLEQVFTDLQGKELFIEDFIKILEDYLAAALIDDIEEKLHKMSPMNLEEPIKHFNLYQEECWMLERFFSAGEIDLYQPLNMQQCHYVLGVLYDNIDLAYYDNDRAFHHLLMAGDFLPAQKLILPMFVTASLNDSGELIDPQAFALAQQTVADILAKEPANQEARLLLECSTIYPKSLKIAEEFNSIVGKPLKSMLFFQNLATDMYQHTLFERKGERNERNMIERAQAQHEWDKNYGLIPKP